MAPLLEGYDVDMVTLALLMRDVMKQSRVLLAILLFVLVGGIVSGAAETKSPNQDELHHCVACCTTQHTATPTLTRVGMQPSESSENRYAVIVSSPYSQTVIRRLVPPPKFLA